MTVTATTTLTTATPTATATTQANATTSADWPTIPLGQAGVIGVTPSPPFPATQVGRSIHGAWSTLPRAFSGATWTALSGPNWSIFPSTMNGCGDQRFLVRWRAVNGTAQVAARWVESEEARGEPGITGTAGPQVIANAGWIEIDGCQTPLSVSMG